MFLVKNRDFWVVGSRQPEGSKLFAMANNQHQKTTADVAQHNMSAFIHEIMTGTVLFPLYQATPLTTAMPRDNDRHGARVYRVERKNIVFVFACVLNSVESTN